LIPAQESLLEESVDLSNQSDEFVPVRTAKIVRKM